MQKSYAQLAYETWIGDQPIDQRQGWHLLSYGEQAKWERVAVRLLSEIKKKTLGDLAATMEAIR